MYQMMYTERLVSSPYLYHPVPLPRDNHHFVNLELFYTICHAITHTHILSALLPHRSENIPEHHLTSSLKALSWRHIIQSTVLMYHMYLIS